LISLLTRKEDFLAPPTGGRYGLGVRQTPKACLLLLLNVELVGHVLWKYTVTEIQWDPIIPSGDKAGGAACAASSQSTDVRGQLDLVLLVVFKKRAKLNLHMEQPKRSGIDAEW
jgi:hypothetical protein